MWIPVSLVYVFLTLCHSVKIATDYLDEAAFLQLTKDHDHVLTILHAGDDCSAPICDKFSQVIPVIRQELTNAGYKLAASSSPALLKKYNIQKAEVMFVRFGVPVFFKGPDLNPDALVDWIHVSLSAQVQKLFDDDFEHLTQAATGATTGDWLIIFHENEYTAIEPIWESLATRLKGRAILAAVDTSVNTVLKNRFSISKSPTIILLGNMYNYNLQVSFENLALFAEGWYRNEKAVKVPVDPSPFEVLTTSIAKSLKAALNDPKNHLVVIGSIGTVALIALVLVACTCMPTKSKTMAKTKDS